MTFRRNFFNLIPRYITELIHITIPPKFSLSFRFYRINVINYLRFENYMKCILLYFSKIYQISSYNLPHEIKRDD